MSSTEALFFRRNRYTFRHHRGRCLPPELDWRWKESTLSPVHPKTLPLQVPVGARIGDWDSSGWMSFLVTLWAWYDDVGRPREPRMSMASGALTPEVAGGPGSDPRCERPC